MTAATAALNFSLSVETGLFLVTAGKLYFLYLASMEARLCKTWLRLAWNYFSKRMSSSNEKLVYRVFLDI